MSNLSENQTESSVSVTVKEFGKLFRKSNRKICENYRKKIYKFSKKEKFFNPRKKLANFSKKEIEKSVKIAEKNWQIF